MTTAATDDAIAAFARRLIDDGSSIPFDVDASALPSLAWALKDLGYAFWSSDPSRLARVADGLARVVALGRERCAAADAVGEIEAVASWIDGIVDLTRGRMTEASDSFESARRRFDDLARLLDAAHVMIPNMMALSILGRHAEAASCGEATQRVLRSLGDRAAAARVSLNLGNLHCRRNDYARAMSQYREAAVLFARIGDHERSIMSDVGMADALASTGDFDESLRMGARANARAAQHGFPVLGALADEAVALVALSRGRFHDALSGLEGCRRTYEQLDMPQHLAIAEKQLADVYVELKLLPEARALLDQVLERFAALEMPVEQGWALAQKGRVLAMLDEPEADSAFEAAAALLATHEVRSGEAAIALARTELALRSGAAPEAMRRAVAAETLYADAGIAEGAVRAAAALADAERLAHRPKDAGERYAATLVRARALELASVEVRCLAGLGSTALAEGDVVAARRAFEEAIGAFERQRRLLPNDDIRHAFLADHLRPYLELLRLALADATAGTGTTQPGPHAAAEVLAGLERFRARVLDERLGTADAAREEDPVDTALRQRLDWLYRRLQRLDEEGQDGAPVDEARRIEHELLERGRRRQFEATAADRSGRSSTSADGFDVDRLRSALGPGEALVEYGVSDGQLFACVATRDRVSVVHPLARWADVLDALDVARFQIETLRHGAAPVARHLDTLVRRTRVRMARLYQLVWAPLVPLLTDRSQVVVVPHEQLASLPFAALHDGTRHLAWTCDLAIAPSAQIFLRGRATAPATARRLVAVGETRRLPQAASEIASIAERFDDAVTLVGDRATIGNLRAEAGRADVLHVACHAQFRADNPRFSALHLVDGALTVDRVENLRLQAATVVLSACETGLASHGRGDETVGLVRAFLLAGAARVVGSLWPVEDAIAARFMGLFYEALRAGGPPASALRAAQRALAAEHPHPGHWAAFAVYGGF